MNTNSELGIDYSIKLEIKKDIEVDAYMFMVCDQPFISEASIKTLKDGFIKSDKGIACIESNGKLGNSAIFSKMHINELLSLDGDTGGKAVIKNIFII